MTWSVCSLIMQQYFKDIEFLKKRLCAVYRFIKSRHFRSNAMQIEMNETFSNKEFHKLTDAQKQYCIKFYKISIQKFKNREFKQNSIDICRKEN